MESFSDYMNQKQKEWNMTKEQFERVNNIFKEIIQFVVCDKELYIESALDEVYSMGVLNNLWNQANKMGAKYCENYVKILIKEGR